MKFNSFIQHLYVCIYIFIYRGLLHAQCCWVNSVCAIINIIIAWFSLQFLPSWFLELLLLCNWGLFVVCVFLSIAFVFIAGFFRSFLLYFVVQWLWQPIDAARCAASWLMFQSSQHFGPSGWIVVSVFHSSRCLFQFCWVQFFVVMLLSLSSYFVYADYGLSCCGSWQALIKRQIYVHTLVRMYVYAYILFYPFRNLEWGLQWSFQLPIFLVMLFCALISLGCGFLMHCVWYAYEYIYTHCHGYTFCVMEMCHTV